MQLRTGLAALALVAGSTVGCGLRTDPSFARICIDDNASVDAGTGTDGGSDGPRVGSCENPVELPAGDDIVVRGALGGCSGTEGWCGGTGAEDVYMVPGTGEDVFIEFRPQDTNFNPVLRVVRGDPCGAGELPETEVCAPIVNSIPGRGFFDQGAEGEPYYIIVDTELGESGEYAFDLRFGESSFAGDCLDAVEEQVIQLGPGGNFVWEGRLDDVQGRLDSDCSSPGNEDLFILDLTGSGTLEASIEVLDGDIEPVLSVRERCTVESELSCGGSVTAEFEEATTALLAVDQLGVADGEYRLTVGYF